MNRKLARQCLLLVNSKEMYDCLQNVISHKIEEHRNNLEKTRDAASVLEIQGSIAELRRLQHLRNEVIEGSKNGPE
jgi:Ribonuclease G/E